MCVTTDALLAENRRLHDFILLLAERLAAASEVLGACAERGKLPKEMVEKFSRFGE